MKITKLQQGNALLDTMYYTENTLIEMLKEHKVFYLITPYFAFKLHNYFLLIIVYSFINSNFN